MDLKLPGCGPKTIEKLAHLNINSRLDLINHLPHRYIDFSHTTTIKLAPVDQNVTISGQILSFQSVYTRSHKNIQKAVITDTTGQITLIWFNQPYLTKIFTVGQNYSFAGTISVYQNKKTIIAPEYGEFNTGAILPVYGQTQGLSSKWFRKTIASQLNSLLAEITETLPPPIINKFHLQTNQAAYRQLHLPTAAKDIELAQHRLAINEILALQALSLLQKQAWASRQPHHILKTTAGFDRQLQKLIDSLPFKLTPAQLRVWQETKTDLLSTTSPANRLIQGDVGSGKTIIALLSAYLTYLNGRQTFFVAPTEILARQHLATFSTIIKDKKCQIKLLTSDTGLTDDQIKKTDIIIATHAILFKNPRLFSRLGLVIIDEQHKFGVKQRALLSSFTNPPHCLTMTATPIPRTVSLTLLGNLAVSLIDELPQNRLAIKTFLVPTPKQSDCYRWIEDKIKSHHLQTYIVCPLIDESEALSEVQAASQQYDYLQTVFSKNIKLALIHGKTSVKDRQKIMADFQAGKIDILVTTPIIEVGVDVANAAIMIIESADRFGLAQLHQLRGRIGRGSTQSYCYLFTASTSVKAHHRLDFLVHHTSGQQIAEYDFTHRGPGEIFSYLQHGFPSLKLAAINDSALAAESQQIITDLTAHYPKFDITQLVSPHLATTISTPTN